MADRGRWLAAVEELLRYMSPTTVSAARAALPRTAPGLHPAGAAQWLGNGPVRQIGSLAVNWVY